MGGGEGKGRGAVCGVSLFLSYHIGMRKGTSVTV